MRQLIFGLDWAIAGAASAVAAAAATPPTPAFLMNERRSICFSSLKLDHLTPTRRPSFSLCALDCTIQSDPALSSHAALPKCPIFSSLAAVAASIRL